VSWGFLAVIIGGAALIAAGFTRAKQTDLKTELGSIARIFAREMEGWLHEQITPQTSPNDRLYVKMIQAEKRWQMLAPQLRNIYTMRRLADGRMITVVDAETDFDGDGKFANWTEQREPIGSPWLIAEVVPFIDRVMAGETTFVMKPRTGGGKQIVTALAPIHNWRGDVEAALGIDYDASAWLAATRRGRLWICAGAAILTLGLTASILALGRFSRVPESPHTTPVPAPAPSNDRRELEFSQRKFETLVHSIDGIVWESDAGSFRFNFVSQQAVRILGYPIEEWLENESFWTEKLHPDDEWAVAHCALMVEKKQPYHYDYRMIAADGRTVWIRESAAVLCDEHGTPAVVRGVFLDITEQKNAVEELEALHKQLIASSRRAGMADVASGVLHNVGNVLNSVNVSAGIIADRLRSSKAADVSKVSSLLFENRADLGNFLTHDPRGKVIPDLLKRLVEAQAKEQETLLAESVSLSKNIDHIRDIIGRQQGHATVSGVRERLVPATVLEDALQINAASLAQRQIEVVKEFGEVPDVLVDRHKMLQIVVNLIRNAQQAMLAAERPDRRLTLGVGLNGDNTVKISVKDNGIGISRANLQRIFNHGFTTKQDGHGFGLHSGALAARDMGGSLSVHSDGPGTGATFTLEIPAAMEPEPDPHGAKTVVVQVRRKTIPRLAEPALCS
jgi:PAS domain S-box-containing protein